MHLILHFDINGTLIIHDNAGGKTKSTLINGILMQSLFGFIKDDRWKQEDLSLLERAQSFEIVSKIPSVEPPVDSKPLIDCHSFMEKYLLPFKHEMQNIPMEQRLKQNHETKQLRKEFISHFVDKNHLGYAFASFKEKLYNTVKDVNILPSFFRCILQLLEDDQTFSIVFRSFGDLHDFELVCEEFNLFCDGKHPQFSNLSEKQIQQLCSFKLDPHHRTTLNESIGFFFQNSMDQIHLIVGSLQRPKTMDTHISLAVEEHMKSMENVKLVSGYHSIHEFLMKQMTKPYQSFCFRDYYYYWNANNEKGHFGKQMFVDLKDQQNFQLFFDDNIKMSGYPTHSILSVRDENGVPLDVEKFQNVFGKHIYCLESIQNENFFYEAVQEKVSIWKGMFE